DVGRNDSQHAATLPTVVGQAEFRLRNYRVRGWQGRRLTCQAAIVKGGEEVANARNAIIGGPKVLLAVSLLAEFAIFGFVGKIGKRSQFEELVNELDDRAMLGGFVGDSVHHAVGRDYDRGNARTLIESGAVGIPGANHRLSVIVEAIGFIVGDDNGALRPVRAVGDRVDRVAQKGFADLRVGVAGVIVVAGKRSFDRRAGRARNKAIEVAVSA